MDPAPVTHLWYLTTVNFDGSSSGSHGIVKFPFVKARARGDGCFHDVGGSLYAHEQYLGLGSDSANPLAASNPFSRLAEEELQGLGDEVKTSSNSSARKSLKLLIAEADGIGRRDRRSSVQLRYD